MNIIKHFLITGDCHGMVETRLKNIKANMSEFPPEETAVIILGDSGINFYLNKTDKKHKKYIEKFGYTIYCVRGNHEQRPELIDDMISIYDEEVQNEVYYEPNFPLIRYLKDGEVYLFGDYKTLVIGGAYSVDKYYRLARAGNKTGWTGWFEREQLTPQEMEQIEEKIKDQSYDFVLTHTCPYSWQPTDLFLQSVDQSMVDNTMELWLDKIVNTFKWKVYLFGHYHCDRVELPYVEQFYRDYENLDTIMQRWEKFKKTNELDWWITVSPKFNKIKDA